MTPNTQHSIRRIHHYLGVFFAPMIVLFALSGALQTFRLQEEKGYGGTPPAWIAWIASVHMDSRLPKPRVVKDDRGESASPKAEAPRAALESATAPKPAAKGPVTLPLKIFVALLALALTLSTVLGVTIALTNRAMRRTTLLLLGAGVVVPLALLLL